MDADQIKSLFDRAAELPVAERAAFLDQHCTDPDVRRRVETLLDQDEVDSSMLSRPAGATFPSVANPVGDRIAGFTIVRQIGQGGMGAVYLAEDAALSRQVAVKVLAAHLVESESAIGRFRQEAKAAARLSHPNIVPVYSCGQDGGLHYIVMEFVEGESLARTLESARRPMHGAPTPERGTEGEPRADVPGSSGRAPPPVPTDEATVRRCVTIVAALAEALEYAHKNGVVHRDVKPSNILIDAEGTPRLADFGIAKITTGEAHTMTESPLGTLQYMSPEQAEILAQKVDHRTDVFSLGVVLYEMLTHRRPFEGKTVAEHLESLRSSTPARLRLVNPGVGKDLDTVCHKAIERAPDDRYQSAAHFAADLACVLRGDPILAKPVGVGRRARQAVYSRRYVLGGLGVAGAGALATGLLVRTFGKPPSPPDLRPTVTSSGFGPDHTLWIRPVNLETGHVETGVQLGPVTASHRVDPGYYRFVVRSPTGDFAEFTRLVREQEEVVLGGTIVPTPTAVRGMVRIDVPGQFPESTDAAYAQKMVGLEPFWIDPHETTCAEYADYLAATGAGPPALWESREHPDGWADLPVTTVSWQEAQRYAEWRGKRLPTSLEWEFAARGVDGRSLPWGDSPKATSVHYPERGGTNGTDPKFANVFSPVDDGENLEGINLSLDGRTTVASRAERLASDPAYRASVREYVQARLLPISAPRDDVSAWHGAPLAHMLGNAAEWTETIVLLGDLDESTSGLWVVRSDTWTRDDGEVGNLRGYMAGSSSERRLGFGLRCARSTDGS